MELNAKYTNELKAQALKGIMYIALVADPIVSFFTYYISDFDFFAILWIFWFICLVNLYLIKKLESLTIPVMLLLIPVSLILIYNLVTDKIYISYWIYLFPIFSFFFLKIRTSIVFNAIFTIILLFTIRSEYLQGQISFVSGMMCSIAYITIAFVSYMVENFKNTIVNRLEQSSTIDFLTEIGNRRKFFEDLDRLINLAKRRNAVFSLLIFDIDYFKKINDVYGHPVGDLILKNLVSLIQSNLRKEDGFYRIGGEEFTILLPTARIEEALTTAERFRILVENQSFVHDIKVTISIGLMEYSPGYDSEGLYNAIDQALYEAKESGRNRFMLYNPSPLKSTP